MAKPDMTADEIFDALYGDLTLEEFNRMVLESDARMFSADRWDWARIIYETYQSLVWC